MRAGLLSEIVTIGYEILLDGDAVKLLYKKADNPPDTVRPLIEELRAHKAEVVSILKATGTTDTPGAIIGDGNRQVPTPPAIVEPGAYKGALWVNPYKQGTPEARQESLLQVIYAIWEPVFDRIAAMWPRGFVSTQEIIKAEREIERVQALVLSGQAKLDDFRKAVDAWERVCMAAVSEHQH